MEGYFVTFTRQIFKNHHVLSDCTCSVHGRLFFMKRATRLRKMPKSDIGLNQADIERLMTAIAKVWSWSYSRQLCIKRATDINGFGVCESMECKKSKRNKHPKVYADHINPRGSWDDNYIKRSFRPSNEYQALCKSCHDKKTRAENKARATKGKSFTDKF